MRVKFAVNSYVIYWSLSNTSFRKGFERLLRDLSIGHTNHLDATEDERSQEDQERSHHLSHDERQESHKHKRSVPNQTNQTNQTRESSICLNDNYYLKTFSKDGYFTIAEVKNLCPVILQQIASRVCNDANDNHDNHHHKEELPQTARSASKLSTPERMS